MNFNVRQLKVINAKEPKILCLSSAASGKALPDSTIIPTPNGLRKVCEIQIGDYLFDADGKPTRVLGIYPQGEKEVYEISFSDGRKARSSIDHIWYVHKESWKKDRYEERTLKQILKNGDLIEKNRSAKWSIPVAPAVEYLKQEYSIPPYVIGAFLGDGCCTLEYLTISSENEEIPNKIKKLINADEIYKNPSNYNWTFKKNGHNIKTSILPKELKELSYNKKIPDNYKYGSIEQRIELIQGLMDTDGSIFKDNRKDHKTTATVNFSSTSLQLIQDVKEVLGSLGYVSSIKEDKRQNKYTKDMAYSLIINISNKEKEKLFSLSRKKEIALSVKNMKQHRNYKKTSIREIKDLGYKEKMTCFYVDNPKHLFLTENFIITHNTRVLTERIRVLVEEKGVPAKEIVAITFTNLAADEMKKRLGDISEDIYIGTIHAYAARICYENNIDVQHYIDTEYFDKILEKALTINRSHYPKVSHLLIDECQDLNDLNYRFINKIPTKNIFYVGDEKQMIYAFRGASEKELMNIYEDASYKKYYLIDNYRNTPSIIKFAESLIASSRHLSPLSNPVKTIKGTVVECPFTEALEELEYNGNWGSWFILGRTNAQVQEAQRILDEKKIPNISFKKGDFGLNELSQLMASDKVKVLTIHTAKGLENKNVIVTGARLYNEEERRIAYVAATRAENSLYWCPGIVPPHKKMEINKKGNIFAQGTNQVIEF